MLTFKTGFFLSLFIATAPAQTRIWEKRSTVPQYGRVLDNAGDIDGDGHDDYVIVGNLFGDGQISVVSGRTDTVLFTKTGGTNHRLGYSVAGAGDINADGFDDIVAGAPGRGASGFVCVFAGPGGEVIRTIDGAAAGYTPFANFGFNVSRAGDINADGFDDFMVGTPEHNSRTGSVQVYSGRDNAILVDLGGTFPDNRLGVAVCPAGDVDGDGFDDYAYAEAVSAGSSTWTATVRSGSDGSILTRLPNVSGASNGAWPRMSDLGDIDGDESHDLALFSPTGTLGVYATSNGVLLRSYAETLSVAGAGDVDGDRCSDFLLGAVSIADVVSVTLISGKNGYPLTRIWPTHVAYVSAIDLDCDGRTEFLAGVPENNGGTVSAYAIDLLGEYRLAGDAPGANFGFTLAEAGDVNNDGIEDLIVGQWLDPTGVGGGSARILSGADFSTLRRLYATGPNDLFGAVAGVGDVNADGYDDVAVGAHMADANGVDSGSVVVFSGRDGTVIHTIVGDSPGASMGAVAGLGDWDGDGVRDFWVGSSGADYGGTDSGSVYVFSGRTGAQLRRFDGDGAGDNFGIVVANAGDVDNDGVDDLITGAPGDDDNGTDCGMMRAISGADGSILHTIYGLRPGDRFGHPVGPAGDVDGDGYADLIGSGQVYTGGPGYVRVHSGRTGAPMQGLNGGSPGSRTAIASARSAMSTATATTSTSSACRATTPPAPMLVPSA